MNHENIKKKIIYRIVFNNKKHVQIYDEYHKYKKQRDIKNAIFQISYTQ